MTTIESVIIVATTVSIATIVAILIDMIDGTIISVTITNVIIKTIGMTANTIMVDATTTTDLALTRAAQIQVSQSTRTEIAAAIDTKTISIVMAD